MDTPVTKQVNYHWRTLRSSSSTLSSPQDKILSKLPFLKLSQSDSNIQERQQKQSRRHNTTAENICDYNLKASSGGVDILEQAEAYHKPKDGIKKVVLTRWTEKGLIHVYFIFLLYLLLGHLFSCLQTRGHPKNMLTR